MIHILNYLTFGLVMQSAQHRLASAQDFSSGLAGFEVQKVLFQKSTPGFLGKNSAVSFFVTDSSSPSDTLPIDVHGVVSTGNGKHAYLSSYGYEGGIAEIVDAFLAESGPEKVRSFFVICRWRTLHRETGTNGYFYKVFAYKYSIKTTPDFGPTVESDSLLSKRFGSGMDGFHEGRESTFGFRTSVSVLKALSKESP